MRHHGRLDARVDGDFAIEVSETPDVVIGSEADWIRHIYLRLGDSSISFVVEDFEVPEIAAALRGAADALDAWATGRAPRSVALEGMPVP